MPVINVPDPFAAMVLLVVFIALCLGQFAIGFFVPQRYRRRRPATLPEQWQEAAAQAEPVESAAPPFEVKVTALPQ